MTAPRNSCADRWRAWRREEKTTAHPRLKVGIKKDKKYRRRWRPQPIPNPPRPRCEECGKSYKSHSGLRAHHRKQHQNVQETTSQETFGLVQPIPSGVADCTSNPVLKLDLMNIAEADFDECRVSEDARICVIDAIARFRGIDAQQASECWQEIRNSGDGPFPVTSKVQFPGIGQRPVDVAVFSDIITILSLLPGKHAKVLRAQQANISTRAIRLTRSRTASRNSCADRWRA